MFHRFDIDEERAEALEAAADDLVERWFQSRTRISEALGCLEDSEYDAIAEAVADNDAQELMRIHREGAARVMRADANLQAHDHLDHMLRRARDEALLDRAGL